MIAVNKSRDRGAEHFDYPSQEFGDPLQALGELVGQLLLMGEKVKEIGAGLIKLEGRVLNCVDTTVFEGPTDEMWDLLLFLYLYLEAAPMGTSNEPVPLNVKAVVPIFNAADLTNFVGWPLGTPNRMRLAALQACGFGYRPNVNIVLERGVRVQDIVAAAELYKEGFCRSFSDALALA